MIQLERGTLDPKRPNNVEKNKLVVDVSSELSVPVHRGDDIEWAPYELKAVICHDGTTGSGHYYTYVRHSEKWYRCSDTNVRWLKKHEVTNSLRTPHAYIYFFEKRSGWN